MGDDFFANLQTIDICRNDMKISNIQHNLLKTFKYLKICANTYKSIDVC